MSSQWYCFTDDESGPYTFRELAEQIARGDLLASDLVRREESEQWKRADEVFGLQREVARVQQLDRLHADRRKTGTFGKQLAKWSEERIPGVSGEQLVLYASLAAMLIFVSQLGWWWFTRVSKFPTAPAAGVVMTGPSRLHQLAPLPPARPTLPQLPRGIPHPVPGFERLTWLKSPTLSADLLTIVYVSYAGEKQLDDLMMAQRQNRSEPFLRHRLLKNVSSSLREAHPTLSPDGLELVFTRLGNPSTLWISRRSSPDDDFPEPQVLKFLNAPETDQHQDGAQFLDSKTLKITLGDQAFTEREQYLAIRESENRFRLTTPLAFTNRWPRYFLTSKGRRAFLPSETGLQVTAFSPRVRQFEEPELLFGSDRTGPDPGAGDDTIWVAPAEDLIFFCGPGLNATRTDSRCLWMIRL